MSSQNSGSLSHDQGTVEIWKDIPECPKYQASSLGRVRTLKRKNGVGHIMTQFLTPNGYKIAKLNQKMWFVHRLVLFAFVGPRPDGMQACHNDNDRQNNRADNLRWDTAKNNNADKRKHGTAQFGENNPSSKFTDTQVMEIRRKYASTSATTRELMDEFGASQAAIASLVRGKTYKHLPILCRPVPSFQGHDGRFVKKTQPA